MQVQLLPTGQNKICHTDCMIENNPQEQLPTIQPIPNLPKVWLPFVVALVAVALVSGGGVYLWQQNEIKQLQNNQLRQTGYINNQVAPTAYQPTTSLASPTPVDPRVELTADGWNKKFLAELNKGDNCSNFFETRFSAKPNTFVTYSSSEFKYSVNFPYNASWGDKENRVKQYDRNSYDKKSLMFGQPSFSEGCSFFQTSLVELPKSTIDQAIQLIDAENVKQNKENTSFPETATYKKNTNLKYPVLEIETANAMFGFVKSAKIFLPSVTLEIANPDSGLVVQLVNSIKILNETTNQDTRTLLTTGNAYNENTVKMGGMAGKACDEEFNHELANTNVTYKNIDKGLELSIPYNKNWGSKNYKINPYDEEKTGISFGEFTIGEGCSWLRNYYLSFETIKSKELVKKEILANDVTAANNIKEYSLKNMPVFMWTQEGPGCWTGAEFIGIKANYKFSFNGSCDEGKDLKTMETLASLMKRI